MKQFICTYQERLILIQAISDQRARTALAKECDNPDSWEVKEIKPVSGEAVILRHKIVVI